jgi:hypothetical protein
MIESPQGGNPSDPGGNEMESEEMKEIPLKVKIEDVERLGEESWW